MSFKVGQRVTVVDSGKTYSTYRDWIEEHGKQWGSQWAYNVDPKNGTKEYTIVAKGEYSEYRSDMLYLIQCDDKVYIIGEQGIKAVETVGFKVGDEVKVTRINKGASSGKADNIGKTAKIIETAYKCSYPHKLDGLGYWYANDEIELVIEKDKVFTLKEAMKLCIDGTKMQPMMVKDTANHMYFDGKDFMYYAKDTSGHSKAQGVLTQNQWRIFVEPPKPPKFTKDTLVYNTDGTIGRVVEDKGVCKGIRRYSVSFNAIRDTVKSVDEAELTAYESR